MLIASIHERDRWPYTGRDSDPARHLYNFAVPRDLNDSEFALIWEQAVLPVLEAFRPQAILLQGGCDALAEDPLSKLTLSNRSHRRAAASLLPMSPRVYATGGGGYNPWAVGRCWTGVWAALAGHEIPERLPQEAEEILREVRWSHSRGRNPPEHWFTTLADEGRDGPIRDEVRSVARTALEPAA